MEKNSKGKHSIEQKDDTVKKNAHVKSTKKGDAEKTKNDIVSEIARDFKDGNCFERSDGHMMSGNMLSVEIETLA